MRNFVQPGEVVTVTAPATVKSGDGVLVGSLFGIAATDADQGAEVELAVVGVFDLPALVPIDAGAPVYWDDTGKVVAASALVGPLVGVALLAVGAQGTVARVRLNGLAGAGADAGTAAALSTLADADTALDGRVTALEGA